MELFNEYRNRSLRALTILAERIANGEVFSESELREEYSRLSGDYNYVFYEKIVNNANDKDEAKSEDKDEAKSEDKDEAKSKDKEKGKTKLPVFDFSKKGHVLLNEMISAQLSCDDDIHISNLPLKTEKIWLNMALNDKLRKLFFSEEELAEFGFDFSEYPLYYRNIDDEWRKNEDISDISAKNFRMILQAINEKKAISYTYNQASCNGTPVKIEYDERTCKIYMIVYDESRFIKADVSKLFDVQLSGEAADNIPDIKEDMEKKKRSVVFTVTDYKNRKAIERALLAFSVYDHVVEPIDEKPHDLLFNTIQWTVISF